MRFGTSKGSTLLQKHKCARFTCYRKEDSQKYLNGKVSKEMVLFHDICMVCYYSTKGKHSQEQEHPLALLTLRSYIDFTLETAALKYNNSDECE